MRIAFALMITALAQTASVRAQQITAAGQPAQLDIRAAGERSIRVTLKPTSFRDDFPFTPALAERSYSAPVLTLRTIAAPVKKTVGSLNVELRPNPLTLIVTNSRGQPVQRIVFESDGSMSFGIGGQPVLGMGEGGPRPERGSPWRDQPVQIDRRGKLDTMEPRWQSDMYGSRNPAAMLIGTAGWGIFVATPWVQVDLQNPERGILIPFKPTGAEAAPQTQRNQQQNLGKGIPPIDRIVPGLVLATMPIYVRAGAIIPFDPVRQYTAQMVSEPTTLRVYRGANGSLTLYDDDGTQDYLDRRGSWIRLSWSDNNRQLTIEPGPPSGAANVVARRQFRVMLLPEGTTRGVTYTGQRAQTRF